MTRALVTGASGFVGEPTIRALRSRIPGIDIHGTSRHHRRDTDVTWHCVDLLSDGTGLISDVRPDLLIHLAWETTHGEFWTSPMNDSWCRASMAMIDAFAGAGGKRAVLAGTCAEYAWDTGAARLHEDSSPIEPASLYGETKAQLHADARAFLAGSGISLAWGRIFFPYGPGEDPRKLITSIADTLLHQTPASIRSGASIRDFIFATDVGAAFAAIADSSSDMAVNVGSGAPLSLRDVGRTIEQALGSSGLLTIEDGTDTSAVVADTSRLTDEIGFVPATPITLGITEVVAALMADSP